MYSIERKSIIMNQLEANGSVDVNTLASNFETSKETIRRDLRDLEADGALIRTHGGAVEKKKDSTAATVEFPVNIRGIQRFAEKNQICKKAAEYIEDGDTLYVDNSSTILYLLNYIPENLNVTIVTNSIKFLLESTRRSYPNQLLISLGGIFRQSNLSVYGGSSIKSGKEYYPNKAFLSCTGISRKNMFVDSSIYEVDVKRMMIEQSTQVFILADYTKFDRPGQIFLCDFSKINYIITDSKTKTAELDYLKQYHIELIIADSETQQED
jgi:DeoR family fructose operon transcriptional repressor